MNIEKYLIGERFRYIEMRTDGTFHYYSHILGREMNGNIRNSSSGTSYIELSGQINRHIFIDAGIKEEKIFIFCENLIGYMPRDGDCPEVKTVKDVVTILKELDNRLVTLYGLRKDCPEGNAIVASPYNPVIPELGQRILYEGKLYVAIKEQKPDSCEGCPLEDTKHPGINCKISKHLILKEVLASKDPKEILDIDIGEVKEHPENYQFRPISFTSRRKHYKLNFKI